MSFSVSSKALFRQKKGILIINPNSTESFTQAIEKALTSDQYALSYFTPSSPGAPASIEGYYDGIVSTHACLQELKERLDWFDGFVVACFSAHPLVHALRELVDKPVVGILEAPLLLGSTLGNRVGILTTSPRWEPLLTHDIASLHLSNLNAAGVVSSGMAVLDLEHMPKEKVTEILCKIAKEELEGKRKADVIVLGCAGMVGLDQAVKKACSPGMVVLDPVACALEVCSSLIRLGVNTSKLGLYASAQIPQA